ncbi:Gp37-like protein [Antrihabitans cavernicola]|uniref:Phage tail protein n=1 Tax=Antrihabitans cavernicola TaxID=2495913 RepID=A0A5A7S1Z8_9NOCA|nr:phage tail protein [Spelaeibacter cavernicola]KAA0016750.1 phage tail protein [Spelaeibacter cavernicola]
MATTVEEIDFDAVFEEITGRLKKEKERRLIPPLVRLWDGDWNLRGIVKRENEASFQFLDNETGVGSLDLPLDYFLSRWMTDVKKRATTNIHITVDKDGSRWSGRMEELLVIKDETGRKFVRALFKHDYEELKHILCWSNPWLPAEVQFPRLWVVFGRARWGLKTTLLCNIMRLESSLWMLPDNPLDASQWFNFNQSTWSMVVKPDTTPDTSVAAIVHSRFKTMHDVSKNIAADAQLSWEARRYLDGDEPPWEGADLRHGCLVFDLIDKSGWNTGTSFGGDLFSGLIHAFTSIGGNGLTQSVETLPDPNMPAEYYEPGFKGSMPSVPGVIFREGEHTGIQSSEFSWKPATDVGVVAGGHSMPGVNELISATVQMIGDLTAMIPGVPPLGGVADAVLRPLYQDTILAFAKWKDPARAQRLGWSHYHEKWADGADAAYTLAWLLAMRTGMWQTRETTRHTLTIADSAPWRVGQRGHGHFFLGDRIGSTVLGMPPGEIFVDRVSELTISWSRKSSPLWKIVIGQREPEDPIIKAFEQMQEMLSMLRDLGVI